MLKYCDNVNCEMAEEPIERISDYRIVDGVVLCIYCYELEQDAQEEINANQPDYEYQIGG